MPTRTAVPTRGTGDRPADMAAIVRRAAAGHQDAWEVLLATYNPLLWSIGAQFRSPPDRTADLVQATWLRLIVGITRIRSPEAVGAWLLVTMRRLCLSAAAERRRERPVPAFDDWTALPEHAAVPEAEVIRAEQAAAVRRALAQLPDRQRRLLWHMAVDPDASYLDISAALTIPIGAIGPTRARALARLRRLLD